MLCVFNHNLKSEKMRTSWPSSGLRTMLPMQGVQVRSLVEELRSFMPCGTVQKIKSKTLKSKKKKAQSIIVIKDHINCAHLPVHWFFVVYPDASVSSSPSTFTQSLQSCFSWSCFLYPEDRIICRHVPKQVGLGYTGSHYWPCSSYWEGKYNIFLQVDIM